VDLKEEVFLVTRVVWKATFYVGDWLPTLRRVFVPSASLRTATPQKIKIRRSFWTTAYTSLKTPGHISDDLDYRQHLCNNLEARRKIAALYFFPVLCLSLLQFLSRLLDGLYL